MGKKRTPTKEEYREKKPKVLELLKQGFPMRRIQDKLDLTQYYAKQMREELIDEGLITREEIKTAFDKYMAENPPSQGLNKTKVYQRYNTDKADARHAKSLSRKETTYNLVKAQKSIVDIANELQTSETAVTYYIKQLIEEGRIARDEVVKKTAGRSAGNIDKNAPEYIKQRDEVVRLLQTGWKTGAIRKSLDITPFLMNVLLRDIKAKKIISREEIDQARLRKKERDIRDLEVIINCGYPVDYFRETHREFTYNETTPLVKELIDKGKVTREQIERNGRRAAKERLNSNCKMSLDEQMLFVADKVRKGYPPRDILKSDKTHSLTMHKVLYQKRLIISKGIVSQEDADKAMKKYIKKALKRKHDNEKKALERERQERRKQEEQERMRELWKLRELATQGLSNEEMANEMHYSKAALIQLKKRAIEKDIWFSDEDIEFFKEQRAKREAKEKEERQKEEAKKQEQERREVEKAIRAEEAEKRRRIKVYEPEYKRLKKLAIAEDDRDIYGKKNVTISSRQKFADLLIKLYEVGARISNQDIEIIQNAVYLHEEFVNVRYLKLLILSSLRNGGIKEAEDMTNSLTAELVDTKYYPKLLEYKKWIKNQRLISRIKQMKTQNLSSAQIAENLHITTAEVTVLLDKQNERLKLTDENER